MQIGARSASSFHSPWQIGDARDRHAQKMRIPEEMKADLAGDKASIVAFGAAAAALAIAGEWQRAVQLLTDLVQVGHIDIRSLGLKFRGFCKALFLGDCRISSLNPF